MEKEEDEEVEEEEEEDEGALQVNCLQALRFVDLVLLLSSDQILKL